MNRCTWASTEPNITYHDTEWGVPVHDDQVLFEFLTLEGAQAGLSWTTILTKREGYREVFYNYDLNILANLSNDELDEIKQNQKIVRNKLKVYSVRSNATAFIKIQQEFGSFNKYIWSFTNNKVIDNIPKTSSDIPTENDLSKTISKDLKKRGFKFVGSTIIYAYLEAVGIINNHLEDCFKRKKLQ